ncbi:hypothetical protein CDL12_14400 [Handroanthus impetiginosus]|uniref:Phorbol-ester/DAG-type domain-containing protein n=1 Tax=Handroanthus impetiginosus TaxID=429701 RepID=A0A2G9H632_9LAMI|nr:hypothetical protein CDL12_14400 [Handroanthus impetiginosus]
MASLPKTSIDHCIHPGHPLTAVDGGDQEYICDGCKTLGIGKRYRCHGCDFDLHEYCGTCPRTLSSFMHQDHTLTLVMRKPQATRQVVRICDVCSDPVEGLFYRCKDCEFDVHPLCTQLPEKLQHALHKIHPLTLESSKITSFCAVCKELCNEWRYRCGICGFDIHLACVLKPVVKCSENNTQTNQRGIPFQPPPQFPHYYYYGFPYGVPYGPTGYHYGPGFNMYQNQCMPPNNFVPQNQVTAASGNSGSGSRWGKLMLSLVGQLGSGVLSNMIFGVDLSGLFAG